MSILGPWLRRVAFSGLVLAFCFFNLSTQAQWSDGGIKADSGQNAKVVQLKHGAHREGRRSDPEMIRWRDYGLGEFIHLGLYSILGGEYKGQPYNGAAEWIRSWDKMPNDVYDSLYKQFNPAKFNPQGWAKMAKDMGVRYVTITTKHHDGFCLWPSQYTNYTIASTPYKKDMLGQMVAAFDKAGIDVYLYFSIMDWHNPDWRYDLQSRADSTAFDRFKVFTKNQLTELLTRYPQTKGLWFDGTWDNSWKKSGAFSDSLDQYLRKLHPGLIIGSRLRADDLGNRHFDANGRLMGDYEQGWERKIPMNYQATHGNDWDCVMTIPQNGWGYAKKWMGHWKTADELIEMLAKCVSLDGNFVINFGPKADGTFRSKALLDAKAVGDWMSVNHVAIYDCGYAKGWDKQDWGYMTKSKDGQKIYMLVFNVPVSSNLRIQPPKNTIVEKAALLKNGQTLVLKKLDNGAYFVQLKQQTHKEPFVITLDINKGKQKTEQINKHI